MPPGFLNSYLLLLKMIKLDVNLLNSLPRIFKNSSVTHLKV